MSETERPRYVLALTLGGETTITQRQRNFALHQRLKDGDPTARGSSNGLSAFVYDVPIERFRMGPDGKSFSFMLDKSDECFARLLNVIADHFDIKCDADEEVDRLRRENSEIRRSLIERMVIEES